MHKDVHRWLSGKSSSESPRSRGISRDLFDDLTDRFEDLGWFGEGSKVG